MMSLFESVKIIFEIIIFLKLNGINVFQKWVKHLHTFHRDVLDGKAENDGPNHAKSHLHITINNFCQRTQKHIAHTVNNAKTITPM